MSEITIHAQSNGDYDAYRRVSKIVLRALNMNNSTRCQSPNLRNGTD